jgi:GT2 family glycosyltransferase
MNRLPIATILVNWNQAELTRATIAALLAVGVAAETIWLADNGSDSDPLPQLQAEFPGLRLLQVGFNAGFAGGNNRAIRAALIDQPEAFFLLNTDALVEPGTIEALWQAITADPGLAAVAPKVYYQGSERILQSVGVAVDPASGETRMLASGEVDRGQHDQPADRQALFGCALLIRAAAWQQVGELWEPFFMYAEEIDWCLRARRLGWRLGYVPQAVVWHHSGGSVGAGSAQKVYWLVRNRFWLRRRHHPGGVASLRGLAYTLALSLLVALRYLRARQWHLAYAVWLGCWDYLLGRSGPQRRADLRLLAQDD